MQNALTEMLMLYDEAFVSQAREQQPNGCVCQVCEQAPKNHIIDKGPDAGLQDGRYFAECEFTASKVKVGTQELLPVSMKYLNHFFQLGCAATLLQMRIFPNAQEVTESMAMLSAIDAFVPVKFSASLVTCVCQVGSRPPEGWPGN